MARLYTCGFELQSIVNGMEFSSGSATTIAIDTTTKRTGAASMRINITAQQRWFGQRFSSSLIGTAVFARVYLRVASAPAAGTRAQVMVFYDSAGVTQRVRVSLDENLRLQLRDTADTQIGSDSAALSLNTWYRVELEVNNGTTTAKARVDGTEFAATTSVASGGTYDAVYFGSPFANATYDIYLDDIAINDASGSYQNSYPGAGGVIMLRPNADGDFHAWQDNAGGAGTANNYTLVDETTPNDATDFIRSRTTDDKDDYNMSASGIGASDIVNVVEMGFRGNRSTGTTSSQVVGRLKGASGGTVTEGAAEVANTTTWRTNDFDTGFVVPSAVISYLVPGTTNPWLQSDLDSMQCGVRCSTGSGDRYVQITAVWAMVDYTPSSTGIKTILGLGKPLVKTVGGLAIASVKTVNGLA